MVKRKKTVAKRKTAVKRTAKKAAPKRRKTAKKKSVAAKLTAFMLGGTKRKTAKRKSTAKRKVAKRATAKRKTTKELHINVALVNMHNQSLKALYSDKNGQCSFHCLFLLSFNTIIFQLLT